MLGVPVLICLVPRTIVGRQSQPWAAHAVTLCSGGLGGWVVHDLGTLELGIAPSKVVSWLEIIDGKM